MDLNTALQIKQIFLSTWYGPIDLMYAFGILGYIIGKKRSLQLLSSLANVIIAGYFLMPFRTLVPVVTGFLFLYMLFVPYLWCFVFSAKCANVWKVMTLLFMSILGLIMGHVYGQKRQS